MRNQEPDFKKSSFRCEDENALVGGGPVGLLSYASGE